jgi:hypothetical protein
MLVALLTEEQKDLLLGQIYGDDSYFNPIQDADDNWIISLEEVNNNINSNFNWINNLQLIEFKPVKNDQP